jgi:hypothetical protein
MFSEVAGLQRILFLRADMGVDYLASKPVFQEILPVQSGMARRLEVGYVHLKFHFAVPRSFYHLTGEHVLRVDGCGKICEQTFERKRVAHRRVYALYFPIDLRKKFLTFDETVIVVAGQDPLSEGIKPVEKALLYTRLHN